MGSFSIWHLLLLGAIVLLLFGKGRISELMGDVAQGIKSFRKGLSDDENTPAPPTATSTPPSQIRDDRIVDVTPAAAPSSSHAETPRPPHNTSA